MKRGSFVSKRSPMNRVSAKVKRERAHEASEYAKVNARSGGRCEVLLEWPERLASDHPVFQHHRCPARAVDHHHLKRPRRLYTFAPMLAHVCRRHHDMVTASYKVGRLIFHDLTSLGWECEIQQKANKWA